MTAMLQMKVELYNYCNGTDAEVAERGLVHCEVVAAGVGPKAPARGAGTQYVAQVQQNQANIGSEVELLKKHNAQKEAELEAMRRQVELLARRVDSATALPAPAVDEATTTANKAFSAFVINQSGTMGEKHFLECWKELVELDERFGPPQAEEDLRKVFAVLAEGAGELTRQAFVPFYLMRVVSCSDFLTFVFRPVASVWPGRLR